MANVKILGTIALKGVLEEIEPQFKAKTGAGFSYVWGPTGTVYEHCRAGEAHDLLIAVPEAIDQMISEGHAVKGSRVDVTKSVVGIAVKAGAPRPKIDTVEDVKKALRAAKSVTYTDPATQAASGLHVAKLLAVWGMTAEINAKTKFGRGIPVAQYLVSGEAEIALQQLCEHMLVKGVDVVGPVPKEIQKVSTMSVAIGAKAQNPAGAKALSDMLAAPSIQPVFRRHGLFALTDV
jgi:molybdate transport system substrate-binding protein